MIVAGFGFRSSVGVTSLQDALGRAAGPGDVADLRAAATLAEKADEPTFLRFAADAGFRIVPVPVRDARAQAPLTRSPASLKAHEVGSVAEACALAAAGPGARLLGPRAVSADGRATCALARRTDR